MVWYKLVNKIGKNCLIANTLNTSEIQTKISLAKISQSPNLSQPPVQTPLNENQNNQTIEPIFMPLNFLKFESTLTITDLIDHVNKTIEKNLINGISCVNSETNDTFASDLVS